MVNVDVENFENEVLKSDIPVIVDFWASWCTPCKVIEPAYKKLSEDFNGRVKFVKCDVDENSSIINKWNIRSVPTFIVFKDGDMLTSVSGTVNVRKLINGVLDDWPVV